MAKYTKGTWEDRVSEHPSQRKLTVVSATGSSQLQEDDVIVATVERDEGTVTTTGTAFNHSNMDSFEGRVQSVFDLVKSVTKLYVSSDHVRGTINDFSLNEDYDKYDYLGVYYCSSGGELSGYTEINTSDVSDRSELVCSLSYPNSSHNEWIMRSAFVIVGYGNNKKSMHFQRNGCIKIYPGGNISNVYTDSNNLVGITRVVGYKVNVLTPSEQSNLNIRQ